jgi:transcriptional regulator with XRE-family HTH domain
MDTEQTLKPAGIMNLKEKIQEVLQQRSFTYEALANYLNITESELDDALENSTLEIRMLELISKELRIPLYSFFRDNHPESLNWKDPYYNVNLWSAQETRLRMEVQALINEVENLRSELRHKDLLIESLQEQLKKK